MAIPIPQPNINPQVIAGGGVPDPMAGFLQALLGGAQMGQNAYQFEKELGLQKQQEERLQREADLKQQNAAAEGEALRQLIIQLAGGSPNLATPTEQGTGPGQSLVPPSARPGPTAPASPLGTLAQVAGNVPAQAVPSLVQNAGPVMRLQQDMQNKADRLRQIDSAVNAIPDESQRAGARSLLTFAELGANLPTEVQRELFPNLFPEGKAVDPAAMQAATAAFKTGAFTWGQARRQAGVPQIEGIPDDVKYVRPTLGLGGTGNQEARRAMGQLGPMQSASAIMDSFSERKAPGVVASWLKSGAGGKITEIMGNALLTDEERSFIQASRQFASGWQLIVSGQAATEQEARRIILTVTETAFDDPNTRRQKRLMRQIMLQSVSDVAGGGSSRVQALERALKLDWGDTQRGFLQDALQKARKFEADIAAGRAIDPIELDRNPAANNEELMQRLDEIARGLEFIYQGGGN